MAIDIETGAYEIDPDELAASDRLLAPVLDAQIWTRRVGSRYARRIGCRSGSCVTWDGRPRRIAVDEVDCGPLVGMSLLYGYELTMKSW